jgi:phosphatidate cytidylyltransferase
MGRHKLAPTLSPKKTVEGSIGGTVAATFLGAAYGFILHNLNLLDFGYILIFAVTAFVCSIAGQIGDLVASAIKRGRGLKDYGNLMPGHGGVLDRFDSIIFTAPLAFVILTFVEILL